MEGQDLNFEVKLLDGDYMIVVKLDKLELVQNYLSNHSIKTVKLDTFEGAGKLTLTQGVRYG